MAAALTPGEDEPEHSEEQQGPRESPEEPQEQAEEEEEDDEEREQRAQALRALLLARSRKSHSVEDAGTDGGSILDSVLRRF